MNTPDPRAAAIFLLVLCFCLPLVSCISDDPGDAAQGLGQVIEALSTPRSLATPQSLATPRALATPRSLATPQGLGAPRDLATPRGLESPRALVTPRPLVTPRSLAVEATQAPTPQPDTTASKPASVAVEVVAEGLEVPWAMAFAPDGRILVTERPGRIRVVKDGALLDAPFATLDVAHVSEAGLMGIALHPRFAENGHLFVCYTYQGGAGGGFGAGSGGRLINRVARLTDVDGAGVDHHVVLDGIPGARNHNGCRLGFGPDGKLYVTMGDAQEPDRAQDLTSPSGKVLRINSDGAGPGDNPFRGPGQSSLVYAYGLRNPQGLAWRPDTGDLFITDHGPRREDEINILQPGGNYGWPDALGLVGDSQYIDPILSFTPTIALSGAAFYNGDTLPEEWNGSFVFATLRAGHLHRVILRGPDYRTVESHERLFQGEFGRLRAVAMSPDGHLYFTTSNRDGRGRPRTGDDKLLRLVGVP